MARLQIYTCALFSSLLLSLFLSLVSLQHFLSYGEMVVRCEGVNITTSLKSADWTVGMFQRAFALYHDQVHMHPDTDLLQTLSLKCGLRHKFFSAQQDT
jgi:hypothetical protein